MKVTPLELPEVLLLTPTIHTDSRGYFYECFRQQQLQQLLGQDIQFVQENQSCSSYGVLRGLHYQRPPQAQAKLVRVVAGEIYDVVVDIRHGSPHFGKTAAIKLDAQSHQQLFVPAGFAHGFLTLSTQATVVYKVNNYYSPAHDAGLAFNDRQLAIQWPLAQDKIILSDKDLQQPSLAQLNSGFNWL